MIFGWWLFIPMAVFFVYLAKLPYEVIVAGAILDSIYYFGDGITERHGLAIFSALIIIAALFLSDRINWRKTI